MIPAASVFNKAFISLSSSQGQADLLKHAKSEALDTLRQIHCAAQSCGLSKNGAASPQLQHHPLHQPQQVQLQQQPQALKPHPQAPPLYPPPAQPQPQISPQAHLHPPLPQPQPQPPAPPLVQTVTKPPAYTQPPPLPQHQYQFQSQQQRAAAALEAIPEREVVSEDPEGSCWPAACAHRESCPKRDRESKTETEKQKGDNKQGAGSEREMEQVMERVKEMMAARKTRRVRSETQVWEEG